MSEDEIRKGFEALIRTLPYGSPIGRYADDPVYSRSGRYIDREVQLAWEFYHAGRNAALEAATNAVVDTYGECQGAKAIRALKGQSNES